MAKYTYYKHTSLAGKVFFYRVENATKKISSNITSAQLDFYQPLGLFEKITAAQMALEVLGLNEEKTP